MVLVVLVTTWEEVAVRQNRCWWLVVWVRVGNATSVPEWWTLAGSILLLVGLSVAVALSPSLRQTAKMANNHASQRHATCKLAVSPRKQMGQFLEQLHSSVLVPAKHDAAHAKLRTWLGWEGAEREG